MEVITLHHTVQLILAILGIATAVLTASKNRWWIVTSLCSQPLWLYSAYIAKQWGMVILCLVYTTSTIYAIKFWWKEKNIQNS